MPIVVEVKSKDDYAKWLGEQKKKVAAAADDPNKAWTEAELMAKGATVYRRELRRLPPGQRQGRARRLPGAGRLQDRDSGRRSRRSRIVLNGKPGTAMPPWKQLSDTDIAAVITYTRNSWGNKAASDAVATARDSGRDARVTSTKGRPRAK